MAGQHPHIRGLYPIIDVGFLREAKGEPLRAAEGVLSGGAKLIQLRAKGLPSGEFLRLALSLSELVHLFGAVLIINDRPDIALLSGDCGVHLGADDLPLRTARKILGPDRIIGISTHSMEEALEAQAEGANYVAFGPIFTTYTKVGVHSPRGLEPIREIKAHLKVPLVAIGGINLENCRQVMEAGADAVAVISALLSAPDIKRRTEEFLEAL